MKDDRVLIVGAGPSGLLLAIWLKTLAPELKFTIIDKTTGPGTTSRATVVQARTIEFYRQLGLAEGLLDEGQVIRHVAIKRDGKVKGRVQFDNAGANLTRYPMALSYPQDRHERLLLRHLTAMGVKVHWNTELKSLVQHDSFVEASFNDRTERFAYVAGCDGARSAVRQSMSIQMLGGTYPQLFLVADVDVANLTNPSQLNICLGDRSLDVFIPLDETGNVRVIHTVTNPKGKECNFEDLRPEIEKSTGLQVENVNWFSVYNAHHRLAQNFQQGRVFLLGDAAHLHSFVGGQGMNTGLGDATNLSWKLAAVVQGRAKPELLETYATEREDLSRTLVHETDRAFTYITDLNFIGFLVRRFLLPIFVPFLWQFAILRTASFAIISQLKLSYLQSSLSEGRAGSLHAGMRLPWVRFAVTDNYENLKPPHWQIHIYGVGDAQGPSYSSDFPVYRFDFTKEVKDAGFLEDTLYFIRPDSHLAVICHVKEEHILRKYVDKWGLVADLANGHATIPNAHIAVEHVATEPVALVPVALMPVTLVPDFGYATPPDEIAEKDHFVDVYEVHDIAADGHAKSA